MRIGLLSDTHNQKERTQRAIETLSVAGVQTLIHAGDFTTPDIVTACASLPMFMVFGNNDADAVPELQAAADEASVNCLGWGAEVEISGKRIAITHGHLHTQSRPLLAAKPDYFICGHSHVSVDRTQGSTRWINPGALYRAKEYSVAILDLEKDKLTFVEIAR